MPLNIESLTAVALILTIIVLVLIILGLGIVTLYGVMLCLRHLKAQPEVQNTIVSPPESKPSPEVKTAPKVVKEAPGRSCGHCGTRIKSDPIRAVVIGNVSYHVFSCPTCKKETLTA